MIAFEFKLTVALGIHVSYLMDSNMKICLKPSPFLQYGRYSVVCFCCILSLLYLPFAIQSLLT